jgi:hypothetical protein
MPMGSGLPPARRNRAMTSSRMVHKLRFALLVRARHRKRQPLEYSRSNKRDNPPETLLTSANRSSGLDLSFTAYTGRCKARHEIRSGRRRKSMAHPALKIKCAKTREMRGVRRPSVLVVMAL